MEKSQQELDADEAWAREQGVPSLEQPFLQKYLDGRDALIQQEKRQRSDHAFRETLSPMAAEASAIVSAIRFEEQQTLWNPEFEHNLAEHEGVNVHPGMMFSLAKERMESSRLWKIIKKMPKGALLHCHLGAMGDLDWLLEETLRTEGMSISAPVPLTTDVLSNAPFAFAYVNGLKTSEASPSLWSTDYKHNEPVPVTKAADTFPGGRSAFITWIKTRATVTHEESLQHHLGPVDVWRKFQSCFSILSGIEFYEPIFRKWIRNILLQLHEDGVRWVDLRTVFVAPFTREGAAAPEEDEDAMLRALQEEIDAFRASDEGQGFWGARLIWTGLRALDTRAIIEDMKRCIENKLEYPELICGYDLVGQEDLGRSLVEVTPELFWFKKTCMEHGVEIPFFFHAGETLGDGDMVDENVFDAVLLGTRRIGHGFSLYKHPLLIDMVKEKKILIESCPVSNEVLRLTSSIMSHPLPALIARGVACSLCNDDPLILGQGNSGMTHDFWQALQGWENLGLEGLASLAENSVRWATFDDCSTKEWQTEIKAGAYGSGVRAQRMKEWQLSWEKFCQWVVLEFGSEVDIGTLD